MSKRNFDKSKKEKWIMLMSSALIVGACTMTGIYVNQSEKEQDEGYVVDLSELDNKQSELLSGVPKEESETVQEEAGSVNSNSVLNETPDSDTQPLDSEALLEEGELDAPVEALESTDGNIMEEMAVGSGAETEIAVNEAVNEEAALEFSVDDKMMWPLSGDVILNYSMDQTIYFPTLDQYKYNPAINISGSTGANISAAAKGSVTEVGSNEEIGNFVKMNLGDGYEVTYGELDTISVSEGDVVAKGQVIATLANPTKYYSLEGTNLYFAVTKDGTSVNPMDYLQ